MSTKQETDAEPTTINVAEQVDMPPERVLELARDFSDVRPQIFPAVSSRHMTVHSIGPTTADVTEGTRVGPLVLWERCTYDWSRPDRVTATVTDSNAYAIPGSRWDITARAAEHGTRVEMTWTRTFQRRPLGRVMSFLYRRTGERSFGKYAREIVKNLEALNARGAPPL